MDKLLKQAKMREEDLPQTEQLKMNYLSAEEVAARRAEVRKVRELMFRAEAKAKRVAKIKSKTYRRIKKKERAKLSAKVDGEVDEDDEEVRMKREAQRATERATLRHKNTGKWAKAMRGRGELDEDQRREINEMLDRGEQLRRRIRGEKDSDASSGDDESDQDEDIGIEGLKARAFDELAQLKGAGPEQETSGNGKSVFDMKFMRDAAAREQREVDKDVDDFLKELGGDETEAGEMATTDGTLVSRTGGRLSFRPGTQVRLSRASSPFAVSSATLPADHSAHRFASLRHLERDPQIDRSASVRRSPLATIPHHLHHHEPTPAAGVFRRRAVQSMAGPARRRPEQDRAEEERAARGQRQQGGRQVQEQATQAAEEPRGREGEGQGRRRRC